MEHPNQGLPRILVCHSGRQHSHQLAMALADQGMLAKYITGVPTCRGAGGPIGRHFLQRAADAYAIPIRSDLVKHVYLASVLRKATGRLLSPSVASTVGHCADHLFDRYVSRFIAAIQPDAVVAYENSALHLFRQAKKHGIATILDAASVHYRWQDRLLPNVHSASVRRWTNRHKDAELALADYILTVSEFARESYLEAGVSGARIRAVPLGVDVERFRSRVFQMEAVDLAERDFRFVYVGNASRQKGLDVLREAARELRSAGERFNCTLIGVAATSRADEWSEGLLRKGWMSHDRLANELPQHDVLVLPSYFDSFGMVIAEAMACGLPTIVTQNVGAKEMITREENGLIVPAGDAAALADAMKWFMARRGDLPRMSLAARSAAERYGWDNYRRRVTELLKSIGSRV